MKTLPFANRRDFDDIRLHQHHSGRAGDGHSPRPVSAKPHDFLKQNEVADSVNPSLWRQAQLARSTDCSG
jgi:alkyl sulfatase BDS1-like metallo-beta-lactamase superfamily hydrolase